MARPKKLKPDAPATELETLVHPADIARKNIPTAETAALMAEEEARAEPKLYPRNADLDPQLVWRGKDEQDSAPLRVETVPIYIQEKLYPEALIRDLQRVSAKEAAPQADLFGSFDRITDEAARLEFYQHAENWSNRMILGDSLLVMNSLAEKEGLRGQVQMIYLDPPFGISFASNWQPSTRSRIVSESARDVTREPEQVKAFRDTWKDGIHTYLAFWRDRLTVARELLTESGSIFVQIGEENVHRMRALLDEVFGPECAVVTLVVKKKGSQRSTLIDPVNDYILWYGRSPRGTGAVKFRALYQARELDADTLDEFTQIELADGTETTVGDLPAPDGSAVDYRLRPSQIEKDWPGSRLFAAWPIFNGGIRPNQMDPVLHRGVMVPPPPGQCWRHPSKADDDGNSGMGRVARAERLTASTIAPRFKRYLGDFPFKTISNWWDGLGGANRPIYVVQTNEEIVKRCILMTTDPGDLVLDPTCGSGIANNAEIDVIHANWVPKIDSARAALNTALATQHAEWQVPRNLPEDAEPAAQEAHAAFWAARRARQAEMDASIARNAETEFLHDRPYTKKNAVRVTGPFTVESLSPHRVLPADEEDQAVMEALAQEAGDPVPERRPLRTRPDSGDDFVIAVLDNLQKAGVQNTKKGERLTFATLRPWPGGSRVSAEGEYEEAGVKKRAAIVIGPEYGTVGPDLVREAARECRDWADAMVVCGFAFDPQVGDSTMNLGRLVVLKARMSQELRAAEAYKAGGGNLFVVFGEPDIALDQADGACVVRLKGVDIFDPTTGEVRSSGRVEDDVACWFVDTDYDGDSFFVRHAYFLGGKDPFEKLKTALKAEVDEDAWASLYRTESRPFAKPKSGRIAVKVINHYGDEAMRVFRL